MQVHDKQKEDREPAKRKAGVENRVRGWTAEGGCPYMLES
jgi:hypothetical protein